MGRRRLVSEEAKASKAFAKMAHEVRAGTNHVIQGTSADVTKIAMTRIHNVLRERNLRARMCSMVHDEIVVLSRFDCALEVLNLIIHLMKQTHNGIDLP